MALVVSPEESDGNDSLGRIQVRPFRWKSREANELEEEEDVLVDEEDTVRRSLVKVMGRRGPGHADDDGRE